MTSIHHSPNPSVFTPRARLLLSKLLWGVVSVLMAQTLPADALIGHWTVDAEGRVRDMGPHGLHPEATGSARVDDEGDVPGVVFGPEKGQLIVPESVEIDRAVAGVSVTARIHLGSMPGKGGVATLVTKRDEWYNPSPYILSVGDDGALVFEANNGQGWIRARSKPRALRAGRDYHVAFTASVEEGIRLYVNGEQVASRNLTQPLQRNGQRLRLGYEQGSEHVQRRPFVGKIYDVRMYGTALDKEHIQQDAEGEPLKGLPEFSYRPRASEPAVKNDQNQWMARIRFDEEPLEQGMVFLRNRITPARVEVDGEERAAWRVRGGSAPDAGWMRSLYVMLTDERFREGRMPVVDVEIEYLYEENAGFDVFADTEKGSRRVDSSWGGSGKWRRRRFQINDAYFASREHGSDQGTNGVDLRVNAYNQDWYIREIRVIGHEREQAPDFARLLQLESVVNPGSPIFLYPRGGSGQLEFTLRNQALIPFAGWQRFVLREHGGGAVMAEEKNEVDIGAEQTRTLSHGFATEDLRFGVYEFELTLGQAGEEDALFRYQGTLGIRSGTELRKATEDEFWFGLDPRLGSPTGSAPLMEWMRWMGVDIVRHAVGRGNRAADARELAVLRDAGLRVSAMLDVPKMENHDAFRRELDQVAAYAAELAAEWKFPYWELGNEPDLPYFFPVGIPRYLEGYYEMYEAIKAVDPDTRVMNGGLAHASHLQASLERTREFFDLLDTDKIDIIAYHAHGAGAEAECRSLRRIQEVAEEFGVTGIPFVDTETGVSARSASQERMQAATVVQKFAFTQSRGHPYMLWFRLLFEAPRQYGNLHTTREPRPAVMSYRAMVESLRGHAFEGMVEVDASATEVYFFHETKGEGRVIVLWTNGASSTLQLRVAETDAEIAELELLDMFGNPMPHTRPGGGIAGFEAGEEPVYLRWRTPGDGFVPVEAPPFLTVSGVEPIHAGQLQSPRARIRNPGDAPRDLRLALSATPGDKLIVETDSQTVSLEGNGQREVEIPLRVGDIAPGLSWPGVWWKLAPIPEGVDIDNLNTLDQLSAIPSTARVTPEDQELRLGEPREKRPGLLMTQVYSPEAQRVTVGASADWWMEWQVNGEVVYDTLESGNGGGFRITDHLVELPLRAGWNEIRVRVESGSQGWKLLVGSPRELAARLPERFPGYHLEMSLSAGDDKLATRTVALQPAEPLVSWNRHFHPGTLPPTLELGEAEVVNPFAVEPDSSLWWQGAEDLSASVWAGQNESGVQVVVEVRDDLHRPADGDADFDAFDGIHLRIAEGEEVTVLRASGDRVEGSESADYSFTRDEEAGISRYQIGFPKDLWKGNALRLTLDVVDRDAGAKRQELRLRDPEAEPSDWHSLLIYR